MLSKNTRKKAKNDSEEAHDNSVRLFEKNLRPENHKIHSSESSKYFHIDKFDFMDLKFKSCRDSIGLNKRKNCNFCKDDTPFNTRE